MSATGIAYASESPVSVLHQISGIVSSELSAAFIATLRSAMLNVGGIRVDHAMGLARLWLIPEGASPADGAYLNYPVDDLLRLLTLESVRHNVVVIGEDLGTVPEGFHDMLEQSGIHGMRVLWFERDAANRLCSAAGLGQDRCSNDLDPLFADSRRLVEGH